MRGAFLPVKQLQIDKLKIFTLRWQVTPNGNQPLHLARRCAVTSPAAVEVIETINSSL